MDKREKMDYIKKELKISDETIRQLGIHACMNQIMYLHGVENVLKCDADSGQGKQYSDDLWRELHPKGIERQ